MRVLLLIIVLFLSNCESNNKVTRDKFTGSDNSNIKSRCNYKDVLGEFGYLVKIKSDKLSNCINFPFEDKNIWHLVYLNSEKENYDVSLEFKELDFYENLSTVFPLELYKVIELSQIKTIFDSDNQVHKIEKIKGRKDKDNYLSVRAFVSFNKEKEELTVNMLYEYLDEGDVYETSVNYLFSFDNCSLKLSKILITG